MRRFFLKRLKDVSGVSGVGNVAEGVVWDDGTVAVRWLSAKPTTELLNSVDDLLAIHGHEGSTEIEYVD